LSQAIERAEGLPLAPETSVVPEDEEDSQPIDESNYTDPVN
jgi:hypothetical protein